jgi:hypothetical protein
MLGSPEEGRLGDNMESNELKNCPFCGSKAEPSCEYDSDDNRPDGEQFFIECSECGAEGAKFYAVTTNENNLSKKQVETQRKYISEAQLSAKIAWNKRVSK